MSVTRHVYKVRHFACPLCRREENLLQWDHEAAPACGCGTLMEITTTAANTINIITDDVPGGFTVENGFRTPQTFYSKSAHRKALAERGCRIAEKGEIRCQ